MEKMKVITLDNEVAIKYIKESLNNEKNLSKYILKNIRIEDGTTTSLIPIGIERITMNELEGGIFHNVKIISTSTAVEAEKDRIDTYNIYNHLLISIKKFIKTNVNNICIIQAFNAEPTFKYLANRVSTMLTFNEEVYFAITEKDDFDDRIEKTLRMADSDIYFIGAMIHLPDSSNNKYLNERELSAEDFELLTLNIEKIFVGAYDGEGFLIWDKNK